MSTAQIWQTDCKNLEKTLRLAEAVGHKLRGGEVIELVSDLGGGKTAFVRGLARGAGSEDEVSSPSFTLSNEYRTKELRLHHFDFYRLAEAGIMRDELAEVMDDPKSVVAVEWGEIIEDVLPAERVTIKINTVSDTERQFEFTYPESLSYLITSDT